MTKSSEEIKQVSIRGQPEEGRGQSPRRKQNETGNRLNADSKY